MLFYGLFLTLACLISQPLSCIQEDFTFFIPYISIIEFLLHAISLYNFTFKHTQQYLPSSPKDSSSMMELQSYSSTSPSLTSDHFSSIDEQKNAIFHLILLLWSLVLCCIVSNFGNGFSGVLFLVYYRGTLPILVYGLYTWTLIAPRLFPDREFSS